MPFCFAPDLRLAILSFVENCPDVQMSTAVQLLVSSIKAEVKKKVSPEAGIFLASQPT
jgi:hypothetical protein